MLWWLMLLALLAATAGGLFLIERKSSRGRSRHRRHRRDRFNNRPMIDLHAGASSDAERSDESNPPRS